MLKKIENQNNFCTNLIQKGYDDYKQTSKDLKSLVEKINEKNGMNAYYIQPY